MQRFLTFLWFAVLALWILFGLVLAGGIVSASPGMPWSALSVQATLWCLPPLAVWGVWRLARRTALFCRTRAPEAVRAAGKAAVLAAKVADKLG